MKSLLIYAYTFFLGSALGSFLSVVLWRLRSGESGILTGRSHCPSCGHVLGPWTLIPILSYLGLRGRCAYCREHISIVYPLLELVTGGLFVCVVARMADLSVLTAINLPTVARILLGWGAMVVIVAFTWYDILYMEVVAEVLVTAIAVLLALLVGSTLFSWSLFGYYATAWSESHWYHTPLWNALLGAWMVYTFLYVQILIPWVLYATSEKKYSLIREVLTLYATFPILIVRELIVGRDTSHVEGEDPAWMGWGDLYIAVFMGLLLGVERSVMALVVAYLVGSIVGVAIMIRQKSSLGDRTEIAFGPFLGVGTIAALLAYEPLLHLSHTFFQKFQDLIVRMM